MHTKGDVERIFKGIIIVVSKTFFFFWMILNVQFFTKKHEESVKRDYFVLYATAIYWKIL